MSELRTIKLTGGPLGDDYKEVLIDSLDMTVMLPVIGPSGLAFEVYRRVGDAEFEFVGE